MINVYKHFYPQGNVKPFCKSVITFDLHSIISIFRYVFAAVDTNHDGKIDFVEYLIQIAALSQGNLNQRLSVAFDM